MPQYGSKSGGSLSAMSVGDPRDNQRWNNKLDSSSYAEIQEPSDLVCMHVNISFYDFRFF